MEPFSCPSHLPKFQTELLSEAFFRARSVDAVMEKSKAVADNDGEGGDEDDEKRSGRLAKSDSDDESAEDENGDEGEDGNRKKVGKVKSGSSGRSKSEDATRTGSFASSTGSSGMTSRGLIPPPKTVLFQNTALFPWSGGLDNENRIIVNVFENLNKRMERSRSRERADTLRRSWKDLEMRTLYQSDLLAEIDEELKSKGSQIQSIKGRLRECNKDLEDAVRERKRKTGEDADIAAIDSQPLIDLLRQPEHQVYLMQEPYIDRRGVKEHHKRLIREREKMRAEESKIGNRNYKETMDLSNFDDHVGIWISAILTIA